MVRTFCDVLMAVPYGTVTDCTSTEPHSDSLTSIVTMYVRMSRWKLAVRVVSYVIVPLSLDQLSNT